MAIQTRIVNSSFTEIYVGGGNFITQSAPTNFHQFWTQKVLTPGESIEDFKEVTASEKAQFEASDAKWERPPQSFIDEWNARCVVSTNGANAIRRNTFGRYNEETGFFELNGLTDVTYEQAVEIMRVPDVALSNPTNGILAYSRARTFFPIIVNNSLSGICNCMVEAEVIRIVDYYIVNNGADPETSPISIAYTGDAFNLCWKLREIKGILKLGINDNNNKHFGGSALSRSHKLETIWLQNLCLNTSLRACASLRADCVAYMVEHAANTAPITLTLHPEAYARVTDELFALAAEKNITIAST